jgi:hypothetical protein
MDGNHKCYVVFSSPPQPELVAWLKADATRSDTTRPAAKCEAARCERCELNRDGFGYQGMLPAHTCGEEE